MAVTVTGTTLAGQEQVQRSDNINDNLALSNYDSLETLEQDLNYIRSVLKQIKGTSSYDSPLTQTLEQVAGALQASYIDANFTGDTTAETPALSDDSNRVATTEYVIDKVQELITSNQVVFTQSTASDTWTINHNLGRFPLVTTLNDSGVVIVGDVTHVDVNNVTITFSEPLSGTAYLT